MKTIKFIITALFLMSVFAGAALKAQIVFPPDTMQLTRGEKGWIDYCSRCHNMSTPKESTDDQWQTSFTHMQELASISDDLVKDIIAYLQASNDENINN
jgi:cytochrome c1